MTQEAGFVTRAKVFALIAVICLWGVQAMAADGLITMRSNYGPKETMDRLEAEVKAKGLTVFARIDHAAGAAEGWLSLRPTQPLLFCDAEGSHPRMHSEHQLGVRSRFTARGWR